MNRRGFLFGGATLLVAPSIISASDGPTNFWCTYQYDAYREVFKVESPFGKQNVPVHHLAERGMDISTFLDQLWQCWDDIEDMRWRRERLTHG